MLIFSYYQILFLVFCYSKIKRCDRHIEFTISQLLFYLFDLINAKFINKFKTIGEKILRRVLNLQLKCRQPCVCLREIRNENVEWLYDFLVFSSNAMYFSSFLKILKKLNFKKFYTRLERN